MNSLISLIEIVNKQKTKKLNIFSASNGMDSKLKSLYHGIAAGNITNDREAIEILYEKPISLPTLKKLKSRLKKRLLNSIFFIDTNKPSFTDYKKAKFELHKEWATIRLLIDRGERVVSLELLRHAFLVSQKFEFTQITLLCLIELVQYYSIINPNLKKARYYESEYEKTKVLNDNESIIQMHYNKLSLLSLTNKSPDQTELLKAIESVEDELNFIFTNHKSYLTTYYYFNILTEKFLIIKEYEECLKVCQQTLKYFKQKKVKNYSIESQINNAIVLSHLSLGNYRIAYELIEKNLSLVTNGSFSWFKILSHQSNISLLIKDFNAATRIVKKAIDHKSLRNFGHYFELFQLHEAYLDFLNKSNRITLNEDVEKNKFRLSKFLNNVPRFSKDKRGLNVAILIVGLLHLLHLKKYDAVLNRLDALKQYSYRYLRNDHTFRSNCFIKMLAKIPDSNYHPVALERNTKKLQSKLSSAKYTYSDNPAELEIIPYETLWEIVLQTLKQKKN